MRFKSPQLCIAVALASSLTACDTGVIAPASSTGDAPRHAPFHSVGARSNLPAPLTDSDLAHVVVYFDTTLVPLQLARSTFRALFNDLSGQKQYRRDFYSLSATSVVIPADAIPSIRDLPFVVDLYVAGDSPAAERFSEADDWSWSTHALHWYYDTPSYTPPSLGSGIKIAIVDGSIHCPLAEIPCGASGTVVGGNPAVYDPAEGSFVHHATMVASVAAAVHGNGQGIRGVAADATIIPVKLFPLPPNPNVCALSAEAIDLAYQLGARVIVLPYGTHCDPFDGNNPELAVVNGLPAAIIAAAGHKNAQSDTVVAPANYPNVVSVAGTRWGANQVEYDDTSRVGDVDIIAGARDVYVVDTDGNRVTASGTSFAAPRVAGAIALIMQRATDIMGVRRPTGGDRRHHA